uniref:Histone H2A/H2B/H3 domain-containing protein n=1 Tax=Panagrolaimus davidi TaxID=227884 RepID=A0A914Q580_9BILA
MAEKLTIFRPSVVQVNPQTRPGNNYGENSDGVLVDQNTDRPARQIGRKCRKNVPKRISGKEPKPFWVDKAGRRWNSPGEIALNNIRCHQKTIKPVFRKRPFERVVREITQEYSDCKWQNVALLALQEATEAVFVNPFHATNLAARHAKRATIMPEDMELVLKFLPPAHPFKKQ